MAINTEIKDIMSKEGVLFDVAEKIEYKRERAEKVAKTFEDRLEKLEKIQNVQSLSSLIEL